MERAEVAACLFRDVVEEAVAVVQTQKKRAEGLGRFGAVAKTGDDAVGGANVFYLLHAVARAGEVGEVEALGHDAVESRSARVEPVPGGGQARGGRGKADDRIAVEVLLCEGFELFSPLSQML